MGATLRERCTANAAAFDRIMREMTQSLGGLVEIFRARFKANSDEFDRIVVEMLKENESLRKLAGPELQPLPEEPPMALLVSMAIRQDHGLGSQGYYDMFGPGEHEKRFKLAIAEMRKIYEEVAGHGFYSVERESYYLSLVPVSIMEKAGGRNEKSFTKVN